MFRRFINQFYKPPRRSTRWTFLLMALLMALLALVPNAKPLNRVTFGSLMLAQLCVFFAESLSITEIENAGRLRIIGFGLVVFAAVIGCANLVYALLSL